MRMIALILLASCAPAPAPEPAPTPTPPPAENQTHDMTNDQYLVPAWNVGDTWTVRFRMRAPNPVKAPDPPPRFETKDWFYTVVGRDAHTVKLLAYSDEHWYWHFDFTPRGRLLRRQNPWSEPPFEPVDDRPIFGLGTSGQHEGAEAWPRFPLEEDFELEGEREGLQQSSRAIGSEMEVVIRSAGFDAGMNVVRTATQRWRPGRPWWSVMRIEVENTDDEGTATFVQIEGEVIAWPAGTP